MRKKSLELVLLLVIVLVFIAMNYDSFNGAIVKNFGNERTITVSRVIDGDTIVDSDGIHYRLLGINTPEKGEKYYKEAGNYTASWVLNKTIKIESKGGDLYGRELAYLFDESGNVNINQKIIEAGFANAYFPEGKDNYYYQFMNAWEKCAETGNVNYCKKSTDEWAACIVVKQFGYDEDLILGNSCSFDCNIGGWSVKDEGRKKYVFENGFILKSNSEIRLSASDFNQTYVWTRTGDTMFLRDANGDLVLWENY